MIKAIIFDCFDVIIGDATKARVIELAKTDPEGAEGLRAVARSADRGIISDEEAVRLQAGFLDMTPENFSEMRNRGEVRNEALIDYIVSLKEKYKLAMLSNISSRARLDIRFLPGQLDQLFDTVVPSGEVGYIKPQPEVYEIVVNRLGVLPEECVMIDDIQVFCEGARTAGLHAIQFLNNTQAITDLEALIDRGEKTE